MELCISWPKLAWQKWSLIWKQKKRGPVTISSTTLPRTTERKEEILTWRESSRSGLKEEKPVGLCKALDYQESEALNALLRKMTAQWLIRNLVWNKTLDCFPFSCNSLLCFSLCPFLLCLQKSIWAKSSAKQQMRSSTQLLLVWSRSVKNTSTPESIHPTRRQSKLRTHF